ncbi:hypothetical protein Mgra_00003515 [Meloidogyne graminicola]|uniref:Uncharacterized protein n=1 Tax=Meloidogyne graminicola TaxID=189291 RepID=A0A8S9ZVF9_9BILA|nr:hypothetical protein Mgra_00003515 [Meloidogyne graminicola]
MDNAKLVIELNSSNNQSKIKLNINGVNIQLNKEIISQLGPFFESQEEIEENSKALFELILEKCNIEIKDSTKRFPILIRLGEVFIEKGNSSIEEENVFNKCGKCGNISNYKYIKLLNFKLLFFFNLFIYIPETLQLLKKNNYKILQIRLIKANEYTLIMDKHHLEKDNSFFEMLNFTKMSHLRNLANAIETNPIRIVDNVSVALDFVERGSFILPTKQYSLAYQMSKERCDLFYFEDAFIRRTYDKYFFNEFNTGKTPKCVKSKGFDATHERSGDDDDHGEAVSWHSNSARDASRSLDIFATFGIFLIALLGFALATLTFIGELIVHTKSQRILRKWRTRRALVMANPSLPIHLMAVAKDLREARQQQRFNKNAESQQSHELMLPADLLKAKPAPPRLSKTVGRSWWRHKVRESHSKINDSTFVSSNTNSAFDGCSISAIDDCGRQRSVISALTLAAISMRNEQKKEEKIEKKNEEIKLRKRRDGGNKNNITTKILKCGNWAVLSNREHVMIRNADEYYDCSDRKWIRTAF